MARLIDADIALENIDEWLDTVGTALIGRGLSYYAELQGCIEDAPTVDAVPVVHGRWIRPHWKNSNYCYDCSECGGEAMHRDYQWAKDGIYPICPNCGARMDGRE